MKITAVSYDALALDTVVPFPLPLVRFSRNPDGFDYWWKLLFFTFELPSPYEMARPPQFAITDALHRYVDAACELASSSCLAYQAQVQVDVRNEKDAGQTETVTFDLPPGELVRGFLALFRQFYSSDELASFAKIRAHLMAASKSADDQGAEQRVARLKAWGKAHSGLLANNLKDLVARRLADHGLLAADFDPGGGKPRELISAFAYGEHLHWGDQRQVVSRWEADQFAGPMNKLRLLEITAGLAHFYMGFAVIVAHWIGRADDGSI